MSAVLHEGQHVASLTCPSCGVPAAVGFGIGARLVVEPDGVATLRVVLRQKGAPHKCGQTEMRLAEPEPAYSQPELDWAERAAGGRDTED